MVSLRWPTVSLKLACTTEPARISTFWAAVLKPSAEAVTLQVPIASSGMRKPPVSLVTPDRDALVPVLMAVTVILGNTAPVLSVTVPEMSPVILCAQTG